MRICGSAIAVGAALIIAVGGTAAADMVALPPVKDNTLYQDAGNAGLISNGAGMFLFAGRIGTGIDPNFNGERRRAVMKFNIAGNIPAGSTINSATLTVTVTMSPEGVNRTNTLHKLTSDWGEGASVALVAGGGGGADAEPGDATWRFTFFDTDTWDMLGGDFVAQASASKNIAGAGSYTFGSTAGMVADVQAWLDDDSTNFGWLLRGDESTLFTARQFASRENLTAASPLLTIDFTNVGNGGNQILITPAINLLLDNN